MVNSPGAMRGAAQRSGSLQRLGGAYLVVVLVVFLAVFFALSFFAFPGADDFCQLPRQGQNPFPRIVAYYQNWTGRYTSLLCWSVSGSLLDLVRHYFLCGLFHLGITLVGCCAFLSALTCGKLWSRKCVLPSLLMCSVYIAGMATVYEGFFWLSGSAPYQLAIALSFLTAAKMLCTPAAERGGSVFKYSGIVVLGLLGAGCNEIPCVLFIGALAISLVVRWLVCRDVPRAWWVTAAVWLVGAAIMFAAPGNYRRLEHFSPHLERSWVFMTYVFFVVDRFLNWLLNAANLGMALLLVPFIPRIRQQCSWLRRVRLVHVLLAIPVWGSFIAVGAAPLFLVSQFEPPARVDNVLFLYFLIGLLVFVILLASWWINRWDGDLRYDQKTWGAALALLTFGLFLSPQSNFPTACSDLFYRAAPFHQQQMARLELIEEAKARGETVVTIPPLTDPPTTLHGYSLADWSWIAQAYAKRFGVERVIVAESSAYRED